MALNKSKHNDVLAIHAGVYALCFLWLGPYFFATTFFTHFITDYVTSRVTSRLFFFEPVNEYNTGWNIKETLWRPLNSKRHWFFVMIGLDQLIHFATLAITYKLTQG